MARVIQNRTVILVSREEHLTYHHVGDLNSDMCFLTNSKEEPVYAGSCNFEIFVEAND